VAQAPAITTVQRVPSPEPTGAYINTAIPANDTRDDQPDALAKITEFANANGDICHLLTDGQIEDLGLRAVREWRIDDGSRQDWKERAEHALDVAAQETEEDDQRDPLWDGDGADIHNPMMTIGALGFAAKASPDLIKGDQVVGVKVFSPPKQPTPPAPPQPQNPQQAAQIQQAMMAQAQQFQAAQQAMDAKNARGARVKYYLNYLIFYRMDGWEDETDQLLHEAPVVGCGLKKVYMSSMGYVPTMCRRSSSASTTTPRASTAAPGSRRSSRSIRMRWRTGSGPASIAKS